MCGIAGIFDYSSENRRFDTELLKKMGDVIIHRGPDSGGEWISNSNKVGFSFRRLAIIDLSAAGNQPMQDESNNYSIVFNGEIYNHEEIRNELIARGYKYKSGTDTETILNGYKEFGKDIIRKMHGMWGFAIWDEYSQELFLSRDRIGIKPLYYYNKNGLFIFASEIKSILEHPEVSRDINLEELPNYLNLGITSRSSSLFKDIHKIQAGHSLTINSKGEIEIERYWHPFENINAAHNLNDKEIQTTLIDLLRTSIKSRMMSDVPFGVFLSGGVDSSLNVALMSELMDRPVDTFTVGFKELEKYNELEYARKVAKLYNTNHHEILIDEQDSFAILDDLIFHEDEPNGDPVCIPLFYLSKLTRDSATTVIQVGEGSDEQFTGYNWMLREYKFYNSYWKAFTALPGFAKKATYGLLKPYFKSKNKFLEADYLRRAVNDEELYLSGISIFSRFHQEYLLKNPSIGDVTANYAKTLHNEAKEMNNSADFLQRVLYLELQQRLAEMLLMRVDKIGMAHSIEARVPFLDHRIVEFTMSLSANQRAPKGKTTKYQLKSAVEGILPSEIIYRKKMGFAAPVREWLRDNWYNYALDTITNSKIVAEHCRLDFIRRIFKLHKERKKNMEKEIYSLLMLALWDKKFL